MTARGIRTDGDAEDLDVEEVLALVNEHNGHRASGDDAPAPAPQPRDARKPDRDGPDRGHADNPDRHHRATPWPEAREIAAHAALKAARAARRAPVSVPLDAALGLTLAAPLTALTDLPSFDTSAMDGWAVAAPAPGPYGKRASWPGTPSPECSPTARPSGSRPVPASPWTPPPSCAASTAAPTPRASCTPPGRSSTARTSARAARSAATATNSSPWAPW